MNDRVAAAGAAAGSLVTRSGYGRLSAGGSSRRASRTLPVADDLGPGIFQLLVADDTSPVQVIELGKPLLDGLRGRRRLIELVLALGELHLELLLRCERVEPALAEHRRADGVSNDREEKEQHESQDDPARGEPF